MGGTRDTAECGHCGAETVPGARACPTCGHPLGSPQPEGASGPPATARNGASTRPGGGGWSPPPQVPARPRDPVPHGRPRSETGPPVAGVESLRHGDVEGQVRGVQTRTEQLGENYQVTIWTFRVERYDDAGNRVLLVPVEMRGRTIRGSVSDGDWVRMHGDVRDGTLRVKEVSNLTTGAVVRARGTPKVLVVVFVVLFVVVLVAVLGFLAWIGWSLVTDGGPSTRLPADFPEPFRAGEFDDFPADLEGELPTDFPFDVPGDSR